MNVYELNREQLLQLKERHLMEMNDSVSYGELAEVDTIISDEEIFKAYAGVDFVEDDFFSSDAEFRE